MKAFRHLGSAMLGGLVLALAATNTSAAGDIKMGEELAREVCRRCHDVEAGGGFKEYPPSFASIAVYRSRKQIYGKIVFAPLHGEMPPLTHRLTPINVENLVAYIVSLENR